MLALSHDAPHFLDTSLVETRPVFCRIAQVGRLNVEIAARHARADLLGKRRRLEGDIVRQAGSQAGGQVRGYGRKYPTPVVDQSCGAEFRRNQPRSYYEVLGTHLP